MNRGAGGRPRRIACSPRGTSGTTLEPTIKDDRHEHGGRDLRMSCFVGAGFGGLAAARGLRRAPVRITIIDRSNHHLFQPLLYQVATAALSPADIAAPIRRIFRHQANVTVMLADATAINVTEKRVVLAGRLGRLRHPHPGQRARPMPISATTTGPSMRPDSRR